MNGISISKALTSLAFIIITACSSYNNPVSVTRSVFRAINTGNTSKALDQICESFVLPIIPDQFLINDVYTLKSDDNFNAIVNMQGEVRINVGIGEIKKEINFDVYLKKENNRWCVQRESFLEFTESLLDISY